MTHQGLWLAMAAVPLLLLGTLQAQLDRGSRVGKITDRSGGVIPGADVQAKRISTNEIFRTLTTSTGDFTIGNLPADVYEIRVKNPGFSSVTLAGIRLEVGQTRRVDAQLQVGDVAETLEVHAEAPLLNTDTATI